MSAEIEVNGIKVVIQGTNVFITSNKAICVRTTINDTAEEKKPVSVQQPVTTPRAVPVQQPVFKPVQQLVSKPVPVPVPSTFTLPDYYRKGPHNIVIEKTPEVKPVATPVSKVPVRDRSNIKPHIDINGTAHHDRDEKFIIIDKPLTIGGCRLAKNGDMLGVIQDGMFTPYRPERLDSFVTAHAGKLILVRNGVPQGFSYDPSTKEWKGVLVSDDMVVVNVIESLTETDYDEDAVGLVYDDKGRAYHCSY